MKKVLLSAILCGVVSLSFSACSSGPEKLVELSKEREEIREEAKICIENDKNDAEKCLDDANKALDDVSERYDAIWETLSEEEKELTQELLKKENL